jgi:hypothetical protein
VFSERSAKLWNVWNPGSHFLKISSMLCLRK